MSLTNSYSPKNVRFADKYIYSLLVSETSITPLRSDFNQLYYKLQSGSNICNRDVFDLVNRAIRSLSYQMVTRGANDFYSRCKKVQPTKMERDELISFCNSDFYQYLTRRQMPLRKVPDGILMVLYIFIALHRNQITLATLPEVVESVMRHISNSIKIIPADFTIDNENNHESTACTNNKILHHCRTREADPA